jgi:hypothetical protein
MSVASGQLGAFVVVGAMLVVMALERAALGRDARADAEGIVVEPGVPDLPRARAVCKG